VTCVHVAGEGGGGVAARSDELVGIAASDTTEVAISKQLVYTIHGHTA